MLKIWAQSAGQEIERSGRELEGCLFVLHSILTEDTVNSDGQVRLALHVPVDEGQFLQQVTPYAGEPGSESKVGRRFKVQPGIIGKAYRERQAQIADRLSDDPEEIVRELMTSWNYSERDAMDVDPSTRSWMAVPLILVDDASTVHGVLYCDATARDYSTEARQKVIFDGCIGIARFVGVRYR